MYNKVTQADIDALRAIVGPENVLLGEGINPDYAHDELGDVSHMPEVLVRVRTTREVSEMMRLASARVIPSPSGAAAPAWWGRRCPSAAASCWRPRK